ncbi:MAG: hypothetical protein E7082_03520 [Bacteroidales bacterium]|nr:hypothetical protein [Bacteroidales bacterium]
MRYIVSIGSNCPEAQAMMRKADGWLSENFLIIDSSGVYSSKALNGTSPDYLNEVVILESQMSVTEITAAAKTFECLCGRSAQSKSFGSIEMDIDIIQAGNTILRPTEFTRAYFLTGLSLLHQS